MKNMNHKLPLFITLLGFCLIAKSQEKPVASAQELADKLSNPVASMISVPFQNNVDYGIGPYNGSKYTLNFQPVHIKTNEWINIRIPGQSTLVICR
jgi:hypothetical protein